MSARRRVLTARTISRAGVLPLLATALLVAAPASNGAASTTETIRRTLAGDDVAIHNLVGSVRVVPGDGSSVVAEITTAGHDAGRLRIEDGPLRGRNTLRIVYPSDRIHVNDMGRFSSSTFRARDDGTLDVRRNEGRRVTLSGRGGGLEASADIVLHVPRGKRVSIYWGRGDGDVRNVEADLRIDGASMTLDAHQVIGSLHVEIGSGGVTVERAKGSVSIETGSGDVEIREVRGDALDVETGSGRIIASAVETAAMTLETGSGDVRASSIRAPRASLETGSGHLDLLLDSDADDLTLESGSGDVSLSVPRSFGAAVHFETGSGDIDSDVPITIRSRGRREINGTIGDGNGRVSVETGSGGITIRGARG